MNNLPKYIKAWEYEETCGNTKIGGGILMVDEFGDDICRLSKGTIREKKIAMLFQASLNLLEWAKEACESERAFYDGSDDRTEPSWLPELEAAVKAATNGDFKN
jgi:hypothetical protein